MQLLDAHRQALDVFDRAVHQIRDDQWQAPTPCTDWTVHDLVNHLTGEQLWVPHLLRGETMEQVGDRYDGDVLGDDPLGTWEDAASAAREAWLADGAVDRRVHLSFGLSGADVYGRQMTMDLTVHGWDLARAIGADPAIPAELATEIDRDFRPQVAQWRGVIFADAVPVPDDAGPVDTLIALVGRDPGWTP